MDRATAYISKTHMIEMRRMRWTTPVRVFFFASPIPIVISPEVYGVKTDYTILNLFSHIQYSNVNPHKHVSEPMFISNYTGKWWFVLAEGNSRWLGCSPHSCIVVRMGWDRGLEGANMFTSTCIHRFYLVIWRLHTLTSGRIQMG